MRKVLVCLLTLALVLGCMSVQAEGVLTPGTYTSTMTAMHGPMTVEVTVTDSAIKFGSGRFGYVHIES